MAAPKNRKSKIRGKNPEPINPPGKIKKKYDHHKLGGSGIRKIPLTVKQIEWLNDYVKTNSIKKSADKVGVNSRTAGDWAGHPLVREEIAKIRATLAEKTGYDLEAAMKECEEAADFARKTKNANAYVKALELKAKLNGLLIEKHDHRMVANFSINVEGVRDKLPVSIDAPRLTEGSGEDLVESVAESVVAETDIAVLGI